MAKDPAFLFYPGDYLRDTQCLSESVQVSYDRIMCEHMRNICITQKQLNFFTKRLTPDQKEELLMVLTEKDGGYCIEWIVDSIVKRRSYSESRRKNREGSKKNKPSIKEKDMLSYDLHMENEIEDEKESINKDQSEVEIWPTFEDFWTAYAKKVGSKEKCKQKFDKLNQDTKEIIMNHIFIYVKATPDKQYRANPETFLNQKRWENEIIKTNGKGQTTSAANEFFKNADPNYKNY